MNNDGTRDCNGGTFPPGLTPPLASSRPGLALGSWPGSVGLVFGRGRAGGRARLAGSRLAPGRGRARVRPRKQDPQADGARAVAATVSTQAACGGPPAGPWPDRVRARRLGAPGRDRAWARGPGSLAGLVAWFGAGLVAGMSRPGTDNTSPLSPLSSWRSDRAFGLVVGSWSGSWSGCGVWSCVPAGLGPSGSRPGSPAGLGYGLGRPRGRARIPQSWSSSLAFASSLHLTGPRFASCGSSKTPAAAASCARSGPSTSSATPACKTA